MKVFVYVEGPADSFALSSLWLQWKEQLQPAGWGIQIIPLTDKSRFFRKIGQVAAEKLVNNDKDLVVGLPDLYPNANYEETEFRHGNVQELKDLQRHLVRQSLKEVYQLDDKDVGKKLDRFCPSALKHDLEMLLLAARAELRAFLGTPDTLGNWIKPVENQNQTRPPKYVVSDLFRTKAGRRYRDTVDASAVLRRVQNLRDILFLSGQPQCPVFIEMLNWIGSNTKIATY
jgi:hypothetical protein